MECSSYSLLSDQGSQFNGVQTIALETPLTHACMHAFTRTHTLTHTYTLTTRAATNVLNQFRTNVVRKRTNIERSIYLRL